MAKLLNDPKLTAYALGELNAQERKEFEMQLQKDPEAKKAVAEIKRAANLLSHELNEQNQAELDGQLVDELKQQIGSAPGRSSWFKLPLLKYGFPTFAVACLVLAVVWDPISRVAQDNEMPDAQVDPAPPEIVEQPKKIVKGKATKELRSNEPKQMLVKQDTPVPAKTEAVMYEEADAPDVRAHNTATKFANAPMVTFKRGNLSGEAQSYGKKSRSRKSMMLGRIRGDALPGSIRPPVIVDDVSKNTEAYDHIQANGWRRVVNSPLSTFSIDVDTAAYANMRRFLMQGRLPPKDAIRIEEMVNYFSYNYKGPTGKHPFAVHVEQARSPWNSKFKLVRVGLQGKRMTNATKPASNLVFLLDVSGSMEQPNKLPLLAQAFKMLVSKLSSKDRIAIVVYAGASGVVLNSTDATNKAKIYRALSQLKAGGSTNGEAGIINAYRIARDNFIPGGVNRIILATDGDFNVGQTSRGELVRLIQKQAKNGVFLTVLGFGMGNYKDAMLEEISGKGNGNYFYIDTLNEAKKVLATELTGTLVTIAKDVKIQIEFNPALVEAYRLIGYENRMLKSKDFNDDKKDAGEIGAGHSVTALYELVPSGQQIDIPTVDKLKYQKPTAPLNKDFRGELMTVKLRYKRPTENKSKLMVVPVKKDGRPFKRASSDFRFATSVASLGMLLREDGFSGDMNYSQVLSMAKAAKGEDKFGYREEFIELVELVRDIIKNR